MPQLFRSSRLKIERAYEHIDQLRAAIEAFFQGDSYELVIQPHPDVSFYDVLTLIPKPLPDIISLAAGDAVHNLRSALDHAMWESIFLGTGVAPSETNSTNFPIKRDYEELVQAIQGREIEGAGPDIIGLILNELTPYNGGNDPLRALHRMDLADKHRLLIPIITFTSVQDVWLEDERGESFPAPFRSMGGLSGGSVGMGIGKGFKVKNKGQATGQVIFDVGNILSHTPVLPTLHQLAQLVTAIVDQFEQKLLT